MCQACTAMAIKAYEATRDEAKDVPNPDRDRLLQVICDKLDPFGMDGDVPLMLGAAASLIVASCQPVSKHRISLWGRLVSRVRLSRTKPASPVVRVFRVN